MEKINGLPNIVTPADIKELAARLGSPVPYDRKGEVILLEPFESAINSHWAKTVTGTGAITVSVDTARNGDSSCKLVTGGLITDHTSIARGIPITTKGKFGLEASFSFPAAGSYTVGLFLYYYNGTTARIFQVLYDSTAGSISLSTTGGAFLLALSGFSPILGNTFHTFKVVGDLNANLYSRLLVDGSEVDLSSVSLYNLGTPFFGPHLRLGVNVDNQAGASVTVYVDNIIVTQNEP